MNFLRAVSRVILGVVFILSGFFKAIDPIGGGLKIKEYLTAFHLDFFDFLSIPGAIFLAAAEFIIGVSILKGLRVRFFALAAFWFMVFFTLLTLVLALFNPVKDCGCFGDAIHLTNWQTFFKNVVLMGAAIIIYLQRNNFEPIAGKIVERFYIVIYSVLIIGISIYALVKIPQIDLGDYKAGTDLIEYQGGAEQEYNTIFIYSKDGQEKEFTINNLPDSTWNFVDSKTTLVSQATGVEHVDFSLKNAEGEYIAGQVLELEQPVFIASFYRVASVSDRTIERLKRLRDTLQANNALFYIMSGNNVDETEKVFDRVNIPLLYTDYKTALSFNRSNGGLTYIYEGTVITKWASGSYPYTLLRHKILSRDPEIIMANSIIGDQLFAEICLGLIFCMIVILRFLSKFLYKRYLSKLEALENIN